MGFEAFKRRSYAFYLLAAIFAVHQFSSKLEFTWAADAGPAACEGLLGGAAPREYAPGIDPATRPNDHFMYGLEVEYSVTDPDVKPALLLTYMPTEDLIPRAEYLAMTPEARAAWVKGHYEQLFPEGPKHESKLRLTIEDPLLPKWLIVDESGNVELVSKPFNTYVDFERYARRVEETFGEGYVQASISGPGSLIYGEESLTDRFIGMRFALGEFDTLEKLEQGWAVHQATPKYTPGKNFTHPYLGPMTSYKARFMRRVAHDNRRGLFDKDVLDRISGLDTSNKYTQNVAYRPDVLRKQSRFINEIRDCVKSFDCLLQRIQREKYLLSHLGPVFDPFESVQHFDPIADFNLISEKAQEFLRKAFPPKDHVEGDDGSDILALEVYRNFAYPIQDWSVWFDRMGISTTSESYQLVKSKQEEYRETLARLGDQVAQNQLTVEEAGRQTRIAMSKFVAESHLRLIFQGWLETNLPGFREGQARHWK